MLPPPFLSERAHHTAGFAGWSAERTGPYTAEAVVSKDREEVAWLFFLLNPESSSLNWQRNRLLMKTDQTTTPLTISSLVKGTS